VLAWLLITKLALATPPPLPVEGPPRIRGLQQLYVTPEAFVRGLVPSEGGAEAAPMAPKNPLVVIRLRDDSPVTAEELADHLKTIDGVQAEVVDGEVRARPGTHADLGVVEVPAGDATRTVGSLGTLQVVPVPNTRMPGGALPAPELAPTGYDLMLHNPMFGMRVEVEVEGTVIGSLGAFQLATIRDVRPGTYRVVLITPTGHREQVEIAAHERAAPKEKKPKK